MAVINKLPETGFVRLKQIIGDRKAKIPALIPVSRTTFLDRVKRGEYPKPVKLGARTVAWKVSDIRALIEKLGA